MGVSMLDEILERSADRIVTLTRVKPEAEYLRDHFEGFPVLPGVLMLEAMVQAGRALVGDRSPGPLTLGQARAIRYGRFVVPGWALRVEVSLVKESEGRFEFKGEALALDPAGQSQGSAASGRFALRGHSTSFGR